jgi:DNA-binding transcriptional ArsR family regulator
MSDFEAVWAGHVRLAILIVLAGRDQVAARRHWVLAALGQTPGGAANVSMLADLLRMTRDDLRQDLADLAEIGLVRVSREIGVLGATLLTPGREVLDGRREVDGVEAPPTAPALEEALRGVSLAATVDQVREHLAWLAAHDLVTNTGAITPTGRLVSQGRETIDGVRSPSPETALRLAASAAASILRG